MSSTVQILLLDDIDGSPADETVEFSLDGANFEIDLSKRNALALRQMLARYIKSARRVSGTRAVAAKPAAHRNGRFAAPAGSRTAAAKGTRRPVGASATKGGSRTKTSRASGTRAASARDAAKRTGAKSRTQVKPRTTRRSSHNPAQVREWARSQGISVSERGRISADLIAKFEGAVR